MSEQRQRFVVDVNFEERGRILGACGRMRLRHRAAAEASSAPPRDLPAFEMGELLAIVCREWMDRDVRRGL